MNNETIKVPANNSVRLEASGLILTVRHTYGSSSEIVVGYPGLPNETRKLDTGDALLFETLDAGIFEIRVFTQSTAAVTFLITHISPRPGIAGAFVTADPSNRPFTPEELNKISVSLQQVRDTLDSQAEMLPEQIALIQKKLGGIENASQRLGRKDWINYVAGVITSTCASAAFAPDVTKSIFVALNSAFSWLFNNALLLLP